MYRRHSRRVLTSVILALALLTAACEEVTAGQRKPAPQPPPATRLAPKDPASPPAAR